MQEKTVITITPQLGSGGAYIGWLVAKRLGYAYIDRQIMQEAAKELMVEDAEIEGREDRLQTFWEKLIAVFAVGAPLGAYTPQQANLVSDEQLAEIERRLITELAAKGPCVVLGRGAFHLLRSRERVLNVMVHAPLGFRVERVMSIYHVRTKAEAIRMIERSDRDRCRYIRAFTGLDWFDARNYHLIIDSGKVDFAMAEKVIVSIAGRLPADGIWSWVHESVLAEPDIHAGGIRRKRE